MKFTILNLLGLTTVLAYLLAFANHGPFAAVAAGWVVAPVIMTSVSGLFQSVNPNGRRIAIYSALATMTLIVSVFSPTLATINLVWWLPQMFVVEYFHQPFQRSYRGRKENKADLFTNS